MKFLKKIQLPKKKQIFFLGIGIIFLSGIITIMFLNNTMAKEVQDTITANEINEILEKKENIVLYLYNSRKENSEIRKVLEKNNVNYKEYDIVNQGKTDYQELLKILEINEQFFNVPAIIYIKEGIMYSNLINIDQTEVLEKYIEDYELYLE